MSLNLRNVCYDWSRYWSLAQMFEADRESKAVLLLPIAAGLHPALEKQPSWGDQGRAGSSERLYNGHMRRSPW
jgi:hypothetical protein